MGGLQVIPQALFAASNISDSVLAKGTGTIAFTIQVLKNQFQAKDGNK